MQYRRIIKRKSYNQIILALAFFAACRPSATTVSSTSPSNVYQVKFDTVPKADNNAAPAYQTTITVIQGEKEIIGNDLFLEARPLDKLPFNQRYLYKNWISENVLRVGDKPIDPESHDTYLIRNDSNENILFLKLHGRHYERFLVFNLRPRTGLQVLPSSQTGIGKELSWVEAEAKFDDGKIVNQGINFRNPTGDKITAVYCIVIRRNGIEISSREFDGFIASHSEEKRRALKNLDHPGESLDLQSGEIIVTKNSKCSITR